MKAADAIPPEPLSPTIVFAIPLAARDICHDWEFVQSNLRRTIRSIRENNAGNYRIVVACNEAPTLDDRRSDDLTVLVVPFAPEWDVSKRGEDKARKRRFIASWLRERLDGDGCYIMLLDADDLVNKELINYVTIHDNRRSYMVDSGYIYDTTTKLLQRMDTGFSRYCGSNFIGYFYRNELPVSPDDVQSVFSRFGVYPSAHEGMVGHRDYANLAKKIGKEPDLLPFCAIVYIANHAESLRRYRLGNRRAINMHGLILPARARAILTSDFAAGDFTPPSSIARESISFIRGLARVGIQQLIRSR